MNWVLSSLFDTAKANYPKKKKKSEINLPPEYEKPYERLTNLWMLVSAC